MSVNKFRLFYHKLIHWEYWPFQLIYVPIYPLWLYYAIRSRSLFFFNAVNPSIKNGGFVMESKKKVYDLIPQKYYPDTLLVEKVMSRSGLGSLLSAKQLTYPLIVKPDVGLRGSAVKKIHNLTELIEYNRLADFDYLIQDYIDLPNEIGVFYIRYPNAPGGKITGIVSKEMVSVTGDGASSIESLVKSNPRYQLKLKTLRKEHAQMSETIPARGEKVVLMPYGSHSRGAKFTDISHLINDRLTALMDSVCTRIDGFYYGRLDIMYQSLPQLEKGEEFLIVELNGAKSEPTHIYDPRHSLLFAWKELARHIAHMYRISRMNHKMQGVPYLDYRSGFRQLAEHQRQLKKLAVI